MKMPGEDDFSSFLRTFYIYFVLLNFCEKSLETFSFVMPDSVDICMQSFHYRLQRDVPDGSF